MGPRTTRSDYCPPEQHSRFNMGREFYLLCLTNEALFRKLNVYVPDIEGRKATHRFQNVSIAKDTQQKQLVSSKQIS